MKTPKTLQEAIAHFADPERAFVAAVNWRWPDGVITCPRCCGRQHSFIKTRLLWFCKGCKRQFTVKVGTIFEDSPIGLDKWMTAVWAVVNCKNGISSHELARMIGVTQKSAWFMLHRIRLAMRTASPGKLGGEGYEVEADEAFIGARAKNMHKNRRLALQRVKNECLRGDTRLIGKTAVVGVLDRKHKTVHATVVPAVNREMLQGAVLDHIQHGSRIYTDEAALYRFIPQEYVHEFVNHLERYVKGRVHTNGIENFWSLLKRGLNGTYVAVEPFHLFRYVDEQVFRYNNRATRDNPMTDSDRFALALSQVAGKRLTYQELTGKTGSQAIA